MNQPERRRVIISSTSSSQPPSKFTSTKPITARVDPSSFTSSPVVSRPGSSSSSASSRPKAQLTSPSTPLQQPFIRSFPSYSSSTNSTPISSKHHPPPPAPTRTSSTSSSVLRSRSTDGRTPLVARQPTGRAKVALSPTLSPNSSHSGWDEDPGYPRTINYIPSNVTVRSSPSTTTSTSRPFSSPSPIPPNLTLNQNALLPPLALQSPVPPSPTFSSLSNNNNNNNNHYYARSPSPSSSFSKISPKLPSQQSSSSPSASTSTSKGRSNSTTSVVSNQAGAEDKERIDSHEVEKGGQTKSAGEAREKEIKRDAKVHRKILDLEITTASLLSINASLELQKLKHISEIRDLRRRLRESSRIHTPLDVDLHPYPSSSSSEEDSEVDLEEVDLDDDEEDWESLLEKDTQFASIVSGIERMVKFGREALIREVKVESLGGRVLNRVELEENEEDGGSEVGEQDWDTSFADGEGEGEDGS